MRGRPPHDDQLTPAEWRIAHAVRHGMAPADMARRLGMSRDGVKFHLRNILGKLGLADRAALQHWIGGPKNGAKGVMGDMEMTSLDFGALGQISRSVGEIGAAEAFWRDIVGLPHLYTFGNLAFFDCAGTRLMLSAEAGQPRAESVLYFRVIDIDAAHAQLAARGAQFIGAPHMIHRHADGTEEWMAFFNDNEARPIAIMSQKRPG